MQSSTMKIVLYILTIFLITSCSSNKEAFKLLDANSDSYDKLKMTKTALIESAVIYVTYNKKSNNFKIELNSRDRERDISIQKCSINKKDATIEPSNGPYDWQKSYLVYSLMPYKRSVTLSCILDNNDRFSITF